MAIGILTVAGHILKFGVMLMGNALLAKWLGALKFQLEKWKDPQLQALVQEAYQSFNDDFKRTLSKDQPLP